MRKSYEMDMTRGPAAAQHTDLHAAAAAVGRTPAAVQCDGYCRVGQFAGANAMASVGSTTSLFNLLINAFIGISVGANVLVARYCGEKNYDGVQQTVQTSLLTGLVGR